MVHIYFLTFLYWFINIVIFCQFSQWFLFSIVSGRLLYMFNLLNRFYRPQLCLFCFFLSNFIGNLDYRIIFLILDCRLIPWVATHSIINRFILFKLYAALINEKAIWMVELMLRYIFILIDLALLCFFQLSDIIF